MMKRVRFAAMVGGCTLLAASAFLPAHAEAQNQTVYGLVQGTNTLIRFTSTTPGTIDQTLPVSGIVSGETLRAIDFRPATGQLYAIATDVTGAQVRLYVINLETGLATGFAPVVTVPTPGTQWGMSFNPVPDRIRLVNNNGENIRLNPNNASLAGNDTNLTSPVAPPPVVDAVAYDRQFPGATQTTLFAINRATNSLAVQGGINGAVPPGPNGGSIADVGPLGVTLAPGASTALEMTTNGVLYGALRPNGGVTGFYVISPGLGAAALLGNIGNGAQQIDSLAVVDPSLTMSPDTGTYTSRQRFDLVLMLNLFGRGVTGGSATFDGLDVSGPLASCVVPGAGAAGLITLRCAGLGGPVVGAGTHVLEVTLVLSDGSQVRRAVTWTVLPVVE